jgi:hypothetical protein
MYTDSRIVILKSPIKIFPTLVSNHYWRATPINEKRAESDSDYASSSQDITKISRKSSSHIQNAANKDIGANPLSQVNLVSYVLGVV